MRYFGAAHANAIDAQAIIVRLRSAGRLDKDLADSVEFLAVSLANISDGLRKLAGS